MTRKMIVRLTMLSLVGVFLSGCLSGVKTARVEDVLGRFSFDLADSMEVRFTEPDHLAYLLPAPEIYVDIVAADADREADGVSRVFEAIGIDYDALPVAGSMAMGEWRLERFDPDADNRWLAVAYQYRGGTVYAFFVSGGPDSDPDSLPASVFVSLDSFAFTDAAGETDRPTTIAELEEYVDETAEFFGGGISIAVLEDGDIAYRYAAGLAAPGVEVGAQYAFHWGSITKLVTGVAVMQLVEEGSVDLDAPVATYIPELPFADRFTVKHALMHSTGLPSSDVTPFVAFGGSEMPSLETVLAGYRGTVGELLFEPGSVAVYNNWNYLVLGVIVERTTGRRLTDYAATEIFDPAGMQNTSYSVAAMPAATPEPYPVISGEVADALISTLSASGADTSGVIAGIVDDDYFLTPFDILPCWGGLKSTAADTVRFASIFLNDGTVDGHRILTRRSVRAMLTMQTGADRTPLGFGLALQVGKRGREPYAGHPGSGEGIESFLRFYPRRGVAIAVLGSMNDYGAATIEEYLYTILVE